MTVWVQMNPSWGNSEDTSEHLKAGCKVDHIIARLSSFDVGEDAFDLSQGPYIWYEAVRSERKGID